MCSTSVKNDVKITVEIISVYPNGFKAKVSNGTHWIEGCFVRLGRVKEWLNSARFSFDSPTFYYSKEMNQAVNNNMGRPPRLLYKFAWATFFEKVVRPNERLVSMYGRRKKQSVHFPAVAKIYKHRDVLTQALEDNQTNILPLILTTGLSPQEMKDLYGKGLWKNLAKNSHHRNKQISRIVDKVPLPDFAEEIKSYNSNFFEIFATVVRRRRREEVKNILKYMKQWPVAHIKRLGPIERTVTILGDSLVMAQRLQERVPNNILNDLNILLDFHDNLAQRERDLWRVKQDQDRMFDLTNSWIPKESSYEDANAVAILTTEQLDKEGKIMHHCVAGYAYHVASGQYLVYHLSDGKEEATLGLQLVNNNVWVCQQMYRECNQTVDSPVLKELAVKLIKEVNEAYREREEK
ncbi:MAG: PcfJ domain-containing protein [Gammaproteobacteria bacterium]|nr:PcfJ domain-containing protein [Gammaproteobacteria bacterium]